MTCKSWPIWHRPMPAPQSAAIRICHRLLMFIREEDIRKSIAIHYRVVNQSTRAHAALPRLVHWRAADEPAEWHSIGMALETIVRTGDEVMTAFINGATKQVGSDHTPDCLQQHAADCAH